jgi:hypothetical protein
MNKTTFDKIRALRSNESDPCVTLLMSKEPGVDGAVHDAGMLKKLMRDCEQALTKMHVDSEVAQRMVATAYRVLEQEREKPNSPYPGLALLLSPANHLLLHTPFNLPDVAVCGRHFYLKPLLPLLTDEQHVAVLVLDQHHTRLLAFDGADPIACSELDLHLPAEEVLEHVSHAGRVGQRNRGTTFAGIHSAGEIDKDAPLLKRWRNVDVGVNDALATLHCPLVLAGVTFETALYRTVNSYPNLVENALGVVVARGAVITLAQAAFHAAKAEFSAPETRARERFDTLQKTMQTTISTPRIVRAAYQGKVDALFLSRNLDFWGHFDGTKLTTNRDDARGSGGESMHSFAAEHTLLHNGNVFLVDAEKMPNHAMTAAILRH